MSAMEDLADAWDEVPDHLLGKPHILTLAHAVRELAIDAESAANAAAINAEPVDGEYQRGRVELAEELATLVGEYTPSEGAWHYIMGALDIITNKAEVLR